MINPDMKQHPIYKDYYGTEDGKVYSIKFKSNRFKELKSMRLKTGYYLLGLCYKKQRIQILHHRFIADIFIPNPNNYREINHKDEDKSNNSVSNLEWCNREYNLEYSKGRVSNQKSKWFIVENIITGKIYKIFNLKQWCENNGVHRSSVYKVINGERKQTKNFVIKRLNTMEECKFK